MKLYVDTSEMQVMVSRESSEKVDEKGRQRSERDSGRLLWSTQVFIQGPEGGDVIAVTTAGERPNVKVGQIVTLAKLEAVPWATNGRSGIAYRAAELKSAVSSVKAS